MSSLLWLIPFLSALAWCQSASLERLEFDHTTVYVRDLHKSGEFYDRVLGLQRIGEPFHDGRHIWYRIGAHHQLHVVSGANSAENHDINVHLAFRVADVPDFSSRLEQMGIPYRKSIRGDGKTATLRPDGVHQIYFQDPDGYWIEINDDKF